MQVKIEFEPITLSLPEDEIDGNTLDESLYQLAMEFGRMVFEKFLSQVDSELMKLRSGEFRKVSNRVKSFSTRTGEITLRRNYYLARDGTYHYLLDEYLGWDKNQRATAGFMKEALVQASQRSYRKSRDELMKQTSGTISHETIRSWVKMTGGKADAVQDQRVKAVFEDGNLPVEPFLSSDRLFLEVDGVNIAVRRGRRVGKGEIKLCILYTGKEPRYSEGLQQSFKLKDKYVFGGLYSSGSLWDRLAVIGETKFGLSRIGEIYWGGDGASWCWSGTKDYPNSIQHLCKYHLNREITAVFGRDNESKVRLKALLRAGDFKAVVDFFIKCRRDLHTDEERKKFDYLGNYIFKNWKGILGWQKGRLKLGQWSGLGAIEGNIDKILACRFKDRGCCWSEEGAHKLAQVRMSWLNRELDEILKWLRIEGRKIKVEAPEVRRKRRVHILKKPLFYRAGKLPSLQISLEKPWQRVLRGIQKGGLL